MNFDIIYDSGKIAVLSNAIIQNDNGRITVHGMWQGECPFEVGADQDSPFQMRCGNIFLSRMWLIRKDEKFLNPFVQIEGIR